MVGDQDAISTSLEVKDNVLQIMNRNRVNSREWFIQQNEIRLDRETSGNFQPRLRSPPESAYPRVFRTWPRLNCSINRSMRARRCCHPPGCTSNTARIFSSTVNFSKNGWFLRQVTDSKVACSQIHGQPRNVAVSDQYPPGIRLDQANDHIKGRRLPRTVWPQQAHNFSLVNLQADTPDHLPSTIIFR